MKLSRLEPADFVALLASVALLLVMAGDWYSTTNAEEARRVEELADPQGGAAAGEIERRVDEDARVVAESGERNAWQADGLIDRVIVVILLLAYALALLSAFLRAAGRRPDPPFTPAAFGAALAGVGALLVAYRIWQEPGFDDFNTVQPWAPVAVIVLGVLSLALATAYRSEESGRAWKRMERVDAAAAAEPPPAPTT